MTEWKLHAVKEWKRARFSTEAIWKFILEPSSSRHGNHLFSMGVTSRGRSVMFFGLSPVNLFCVCETRMRCLRHWALRAGLLATEMGLRVLVQFQNVFFFVQWALNQGITFSRANDKQVFMKLFEAVPKSPQRKLCRWHPYRNKDVARLQLPR